MTARDLAALAARYVGRRVMLTSEPRAATIARVTARGLVVKLDDPIRADDIAAYLDD